MRKAILFMIFFFLTTIGNVSASDRYQWMWSNDKVGFFFDTDSIKFSNDSTEKNIIIDVWVKTVYSSDGVQELISKVDSTEIKNDLRNFKYSLGHYQISVNNRQIKDFESYWYGSDGSLIHKFPNNYEPWRSIVPGSNAEGWADHITEYAADNFDSIYRRSK